MKVYKVWLSYDLGFDDVAEKLSDEEKEQKYNERYAAFMPWLKEHKAIECGNSVAKFRYVVEDDEYTKRVLKDEILGVFRDAKIRDIRGIRMYAIWAIRTLSGNVSYVNSEFIIGERHDVNPWD